ncbi:MAG TPA: hypothetical protein V6C88_12820, partial [Chroococcidiopsis sp.]
PSGRKPTSATRRSRKSTTPPVQPNPPVPCELGELDASGRHDIARPEEHEAAQPTANDAVRPAENEAGQPEEAIAQSNRDAIPPTTDWQSVASFTLTVQRHVIDQRIDYQTVVHDIALDQTTTWSSVETTQLQDWITSYLTPLDTAQPAHVSTLDEPLSNPLSDDLSKHLFGPQPLAIQIHQLQILQPPHSQTSNQANGNTSSQANGYPPMVVDRVNQAFLNSLQSHHPFSLTAEFELTGAAEISPTASFSYMAQVFARHRSTGHIIPLSRVVTTERVGQTRRYHASFPEMAIAEAGLYRLQVLVSLQQIKASSGYFEVPMLQVV